MSAYSDVENYIEKTINHIIYVRKNKQYPVKIFIYLQNNGASSYDFPCIKNKLVQPIHNLAIDQNFRTTYPVE